MLIEVQEYGERKTSISVEELAAAAPVRIKLSERVPDTEGEAFDLISWYRQWTSQTERQPTHLLVEAADEFQAAIPWAELERAAVLYAVDGKPLDKGFPIRLYVPDGSSKCLNVKSVVRMAFVVQEGEEPASFGFKNTVSPEELKIGLKGAR